MAIAYIVRHGKKGPTTETTFWKPNTALHPDHTGQLETIAQAYGLRPMDAVFFSEGFRRTFDTGNLMTGLPPISARELSPLALFSDEQWKLMYAKPDGTMRSDADVLIDYREEMQQVGVLGAAFVRDRVFTAPSSRLMFVTHQPVMESIVATLFQQWPLMMPVALFSEGDIVRIDFDGKGNITGFQYLSAANAAAVLGSRTLPESLDR